MTQFIKDLHSISIKDVPLVGGKTASLGEMMGQLEEQGIEIPPGFAITAEAYTLVIAQDEIDQKIQSLLENIDTKDMNSLSQTGQQIRSLIKNVGLPSKLEEQIIDAYRTLEKETGIIDCDVAVRSSATAEDLPDASFAGQQESFLNVRGTEKLLRACLNCFASLYTDRAISYRVNKGFKHADVKLSICVQQMVRSDLGSSGVIFTLEPESGANNVILVTSSYGLGENIVGGKVDPDEFLVQKELIEKSSRPIIRSKIGAKQKRLIYDFTGEQATKNIEVPEIERTRPSLSDKDILKLAKWAKIIEDHYSGIHQKFMPMDIEWAKDGRTGKLFILQARPETVHSTKNKMAIESYQLQEKGTVLLRGRAVGSKVGSGKVRIIQGVNELSSFQEGEVLVTDMTDPDWEPVMKKAGAIITNRGGRTCHAAIISREHGVPCIVGTELATERLRNQQNVTVSCAEGDEGHVYEGVLKYSVKKVNYQQTTKNRTKVMVNLGNPNEAFKSAILPVAGVGLARMEFIINEIKIHPMALINFDKIKNLETKKSIEQIIGNTERPTDYFVNKLAEGIATIAGAFYPRPVIVRFSDFKTNEYANLLGGKEFEPVEENPMIGFRGASRYYHPKYREAFALECQSIKYVRDVIGLTNIKVMVPFCRTPQEGKAVLEEMSRNQLIPGQNGLETYVMAELPSNVMNAQGFAEYFDGFSIGSNDLTQMILGVDRDSEIIQHLFDERDPAVKKMLALVIREAHKAGIPIGICGQAPSDYPEITKFLVGEGIDSISVTADVALRTLEIVSEIEGGKILKQETTHSAHGLDHF